MFLCFFLQSLFDHTKEKYYSVCRNENLNRLNRAPSPSLTTNWMFSSPAYIDAKMSAAATAAAAAKSEVAAAAAAARKLSAGKKERKISDATKRSLRSPNFDVWKWNHEEVREKCFLW